MVDFIIIFYIYFETCSIPTAETLVLLLLSILTLESADSIRFLYKHFLSKLTDKSLNAFYYACSYAKVDYSRFMNATASMALKLIPKSLETQPVFLFIDDTIVRGYLNGHCFVSVMLCVPVWDKDKIVYQALPLSYRMWQKEESKLKLAASMVRQACKTWETPFGGTGKGLKCW